jgi:hypothetical protein
LKPPILGSEVFFVRALPFTEPWAATPSRGSPFRSHFPYPGGTPVWALSLIPLQNHVGSLVYLSVYQSVKCQRFSFFPPPVSPKGAHTEYVQHIGGMYIPRAWTGIPGGQRRRSGVKTSQVRIFLSTGDAFWPPVRSSVAG